MIEFREAHLDHEMPAVTRRLWDQKDRKDAEPVEIDLPTLSQHELHVGLRDTGTALIVGYSTKAFQGLGIGKWLVGLSCQLARLDGKKEITFMNCNRAAQELINKSGVTVIDIMTGRTREEKTITISHF